MALYDDPYKTGQQYGAIVGRLAPFVFNPIGSAVKAGYNALTNGPVGKFVSGAVSGLPGTGPTPQQTVDTLRAGEFGMNDRGAGFDPLKPLPTGPAALKNLDFSSKAKPGETRQVNYGYGDNITGTADATGRFTSFTNVPNGGAAPAPPNPNIVGSPASMAILSGDSAAALQQARLAAIGRGESVDLSGAAPAGATYGPVGTTTPYGTPGPGGGPSTADVIAASGDSFPRGLGANYRARQAARIRYQQTLAEAAQQNAQSAALQAQATQLHAANQLPIAQLQSIPQMVTAQAHLLTAQTTPGLERARIAATERGQTLGYLPHIPKLQLDTEVLKQLQSGTPGAMDRARELATLTSPRNIAQPKGYSIHEAPTLGGAFVFNQDTGQREFISAQSLQAETEAKKKKALQDAVK